MSKKLTIEQVIERAQDTHGDLYDYSQAVYEGSASKMKIICEQHGPFYQTAYVHTSGGGCPRCSGLHKRSTEEFIEECIEVHGDRYDYSKVIYSTLAEHIIIGCKKHGDFYMTPKVHMKDKSNCPKCEQDKRDEIRAEKKAANDARILAHKNKRKSHNFDDALKRQFGRGL